jgi:PAS domain-containing protein
MSRDQKSLQSADGQSPNGAILAFARHRQSLLRRAAAIVSADDFAAKADECEPLPLVAALLASSLEALLAAEEELIEQDNSLASARSQLERQISYFRRLFDLAPAPLLLTDPFGSVLLVNGAALRLLKIVDAYQLVDEPFVNLIPLQQQAKFRNELSRVAVAEHVVDWRMTVARHADTPIEVSAAVEIASGLGRDGGDALAWCFRPTASGPTLSSVASTEAALAALG